MSRACSISGTPRWRAVLTNRGRFAGKAVIVTGAGSGIGRAAAEGFAREGAGVLLAGRSASVEAAAGELQKSGGRARAFVGDLSAEESARALVEACVREFTTVDILVNAAGVGRAGAVTDLSLADWREIMDHNLTNTFLCCREALKVMRPKKSGVIVNVASLAGRFRSGLGGAHYAASKAAVIGFTRQVAGEVARDGVCVNVSCPGATETPMLVAEARKANRSLDEIRKVVPLGYVSSAQEQAQAILFLASDESRYITGAALDVNGGIFG